MDFSVAELDRSAGQPGQTGVVRDQDDGQALPLVEVLEDRPDLLAPGRIEVSRRLVGEQDFGPVDQGPGDGHPLHLAVRELAGEAVGALVEAEKLQDAADVLLGSRFLEEGEGQDDILEDGQGGNEIEPLEDMAENVPAAVVVENHESAGIREKSSNVQDDVE